MLLLFIIPATIASAPATLFKGMSTKGMLPTIYSAPRLFESSAVEPETLQIFAFRVQFKKDSSTLTTGTGIFGLADDARELKWYSGTKPAYKYDNLPHDSLYCAHQLAFVADYFKKVSKGRLILQSEVFPSGRTTADSVPNQMMHYSPAEKKAKETENDFYYRKTIGLMDFVVDALRAISSQKDTAWLSRLVQDPKTGIFTDKQTGHKALLMIFHAGSSYLTDGGTGGSLARNSQSDMIDNFISRDFFKAFKDTLKLDTAGVSVNHNGSQLLLDEVMIVSETSNQDSLNWGIHGILANQIARAIGIPDLYSPSGLPAIGAFCLMDFAGYSAGNGFIPPWPSAWVRMFMGWDRPLLVKPGYSTSLRLKALMQSDSSVQDTTMIMIPLSDHEYYLLENRQRNLSASESVFNHDTSFDDAKKIFISSYPYNVNLSDAALNTTAQSNCISRVKNYDIGLPASGVCVWHIDDRIIRERLKYNLINADSLFRGVSLVEADGVSDLGISFSDALFQAAYDWGGSEDVFPHRVKKTKKGIETATTIDSMGPYSRPATRLNDGSHSGLSLTIRSVSTPLSETMAIRDYYVEDFADSIFTVGISWGQPLPASSPTNTDAVPVRIGGWPHRIAPADTAFDPVFCNLDKSDSAAEIIVTTHSSKIYLWPASASSKTYGTRTGFVATSGTIFSDSTRLDSLRTQDTLYSLTLPAQPTEIPTVLNNGLFIPAGNSIIALDSISNSDSSALHDTTATLAFRVLALPDTISTPLCGYENPNWALGTRHGLVIFGNTSLTAFDSLRLPGNVAVNAVAALEKSPRSIVAILENGSIYILNASTHAILASGALKKGIPPYKLVTGDINNDTSLEIIVVDSRQGTWCLNQSLTPAFGWNESPLDWASLYNTSESTNKNDRSQYPVNFGTPSLADIDGDGFLDIIVGGTNGIYAYNYKAVLLYGWPSYLDRKFWYWRGSVHTTPTIIKLPSGAPRMLFSSPTGEKATFAFFKVDSTNSAKTRVYFTRPNKTIDSLSGSKATIDTILRLNDSLVADYIVPGGYLDAIDASGKRPVFVATPGPTGAERQSFWPQSIGSSALSPPVISYNSFDSSGLVAVASADGFIHAWGISHIGSVPWASQGATAERTFTAAPPGVATAQASGKALQFYSYPNPAQDVSEVQVRFKLSGPATDIRLDIFTMTGFHIYSWIADPKTFKANWTSWNELPHNISLKNIGRGVYRCRMEAKVNGSKVTEFWKMAVVK